MHFLTSTNPPHKGRDGILTNSNKMKQQMLILSRDKRVGAYCPYVLFFPTKGQKQTHAMETSNRVPCKEA